MKNSHTLWIAFGLGVLGGFFVLSGGNTYGAGKWGQSTFGMIYNKAATAVAPTPVAN
jgi:hypothetical protein